jgi:hypothetical protein
VKITYAILLIAIVCSQIGCDRGGANTAGNASNSSANGTSDVANSESSKPDAEPQLFADVTKKIGVDFVHEPGEYRDAHFMPRMVGSGAAALDYDGDDRLDLFLIQNGGEKSSTTCRLFHQETDGTFKDVSKGSGLDVKAMGMGVAVGDANNDGRVDLVLTEYGRTRLFLNRSNSAEPVFEDVTEAAGIENVFWGTSCAFFDYDRDGWLDLIVVNYVNYDPGRWCAPDNGRRDFCGPDNFPGRIAKLFRNQGASSNDRDSARFEDVTSASGLAQHPGPGLGVFCADFNGDRWPDIFIANDGKPNHLWINQQDGTFTEEGLQSGVATNAMGKAEANMGIAIGDIDGNGLFDLLVTHLTTETHTLWAQGPRGLFQDKTVATGVTTTWRGTGFGAVMADFDNDGAVDLSMVNGRVLRGETPKVLLPGMDSFWAPYSERNQLLLNDGRGRLRDVSEANPAISGEAAVSRGLLCADFDSDGGLDLVVTRVAAPAAIYHNVAQNRGHWLLVRAIEPALHREAYGAEIYLTAGKTKQQQWCNPAYSYLCSNDPRAHFGLGSAMHYDSLTVVWADGVEESFEGGAADRVVVLKRGEGKEVPPQ